MVQLRTLSDQLEQARSQYAASTAQLAKIQRDLRENRRELAHRTAQPEGQPAGDRAADRGAVLHEQTSTIEVILGAKSLDDMISRLDNARSVTSLDTNVLGQVKTFRTAVIRNRAQLATARRDQQRVVAERAAAKRSIESRISEQQTLYNSIKGQIATMIAAERRRQLQMAQQVQAQLFAAHRAQQQQASDTVVGISAVAPEASTVVAPPSTHGGVVGVALGELGTPYVWGGAAPGGFDCSGLVMWAYAQVGVSLPHSTYALYCDGRPGLERPAAAGRPRLLRRRRPRGHLHRRRPVRPRTAHRRRRQDLQPLRRLVRGDLRRRAPNPLVVSGVPRRSAGVQRVDVVREVLEGDLAAEFQRRRQLAVLDREVARQHPEPLDLLEAASGRR